MRFAVVILLAACVHQAVVGCLAPAPCSEFVGSVPAFTGSLAELKLSAIDLTPSGFQVTTCDGRTLRLRGDRVLGLSWNDRLHCLEADCR